MYSILSIDIDDERIKIVEGNKSINGRKTLLKRAITLALPPGIVEDGKIIDAFTIQTIIMKTLAKNSIKARNIILLVSANLVVIRNIELPILKRRSEIISMINYEMKQLLPNNLSFVISYKKIGISKKKTGYAMYVVYAMPEEIYNQFVELSKMLKLNLIALSCASIFLEKIIQKKIKINNREYLNNVNAFINIDFGKITFSVLNRGINDFSRVIYFGSENDVNNINYVAESGEIYCKLEQSNDIIDINIIIEEISKYIRYYYSIYKDLEINKIYIYGRGSSIYGIEQYIFSNLNINVEVINEVSIICECVNKFNILSYFDVCLSFEFSQRDINFLSGKIHEHIHRFNLGVVIMATSFIFVLVVIYYVQDSLIDSYNTKTEIDRMNLFLTDEENIKLDLEAEERKKNIVNLNDFITQADFAEDKIKEIDAVTTDIFEQISFAKPSGCKVVYISIDKISIQIKCVSYELNDAMTFEKNLRDIDFVKDVFIPEVRVNNEDTYKYSFTAICFLKEDTIN